MSREDLLPTMSTEDHGCKVTSVCKHKERKPKKPHYIPRPWGKPYNYKCFQCPFTCMEKSHLYNHMKYSLCKNSLSLLIESDWPYKKGNMAHPDQLRPLQRAHGLHREGKGEAEPEERPRTRRSPEGEGGGSLGGEEEEEEGGRAEGAEVMGLNRENGGVEGTAKKAKPAESSELLMADMFSLEDQLLQARALEGEARLKHYKLSKTCLTTPGLLAEQWRLLATGHSKAPKPEGGAPPRTGPGSLYPPPPGLADYQDPIAGLNLSVLGVGYPLGPGLLSYVNSVPSASGVPAPSHAQLAQLPFLASAAQLLHPASQPHADRTLLPPRFYYPFLCEHAFGAASAFTEASKGPKTSASGPEPGRPPGCPQPKVSLWRVPGVRPAGTAPARPASWASHPQGDAPEPGSRPGEKPLAAAKDGKAGWGLKRPGAAMSVRGHGAPVEKRPAVGFTFDLLRNVQNNMPAATDKLLLHSSFQSAQPQSHQAEQWYSHPPTSPNSESSSPPRCARPKEQDCSPGPVSAESASALLSDLSKALLDYQQAERRVSVLEKQELPAQGHLWEHLSKIRSELSHIHQALERTARQSEGPLDLSVKKDPAATTDMAASDLGAATADGILKDNMASETEEEEEEEMDEEKDGQDTEEEEEEEERRAMKASLESRKQSLDLLIKMGQAGLSPGRVGVRAGPAEAPWPGRTTKCEADSSVLLSPDGRPALFSHVPSSAEKHLKRTPSIQQCPRSPLASTHS